MRRRVNTWIITWNSSKTRRRIRMHGSWGIVNQNALIFFNMIMLGLYLFFSTLVLLHWESSLIKWRRGTDQLTCCIEFILGLEGQTFLEQSIINCINHYVLFTKTENSLKVVIKDKTKLRANITSPQISDVDHQRWLLIGAGKKMTYPSMVLSFSNISDHLKAWGQTQM